MVKPLYEWKYIRPFTWAVVAPALLFIVIFLILVIVGSCSSQPPGGGLAPGVKKVLVP